MAVHAVRPLHSRVRMTAVAKVSFTCVALGQARLRQRYSVMLPVGRDIRPDIPSYPVFPPAQEQLHVGAFHVSSRLDALFLLVGQFDFRAL